MGPQSSQLNFLIVFLPAIIGGVIAYLSPNIKSQWDFVFVLMYVLGFLMFLFAKFKVLKPRQYFSFGFSLMQPKDKIIYVMAYLLMIIGLFLHLYL